MDEKRLEEIHSQARSSYISGDTAIELINEIRRLRTRIDLFQQIIELRREVDAVKREVSWR